MCHRSVLAEVMSIVTDIGESILCVLRKQGGKQLLTVNRTEEILYLLPTLKAI